MKQPSVEISGVWLRRIGNEAQVLVERTFGEKRYWVKVITEHVDGSFSHIAEVGRIKLAPLDPLTFKATT